MLRLLAVLVVTTVVTLAIAAGAIRFVGAEPVSGTWVAWGDRAHSSPEELSAWLASRGRSYEVWAERHPRAAARLEGRVETPAAGAPSARPALPRATIAREAVEPHGTIWLAAVGAVLGAVALAGALVGGRRLAAASGAGGLVRMRPLRLPSTVGARAQLSRTGSAAKPVARLARSAVRAVWAGAYRTGGGAEPVARLARSAMRAVWTRAYRTGGGAEPVARLARSAVRAVRTGAHRSTRLVDTYRWELAGCAITVCMAYAFVVVLER